MHRLSDTAFSLHAREPRGNTNTFPKCSEPACPEIRGPGKSRQQGVSHPEHLLGIESCYLAVFTEPLLWAEGGDSTVTPSPAQAPDTISTPVLTTGKHGGEASTWSLCSGSLADPDTCLFFSF